MKARAFVAGLLLACASGGVLADLYLWKDPATGTMRIYSYPPPWYGNPALEKRAPKVERIPGRQRAPVVQAEPVPAIEPPATPEAEPGVPPPPPVTKPPAELSR